MEGKGGGRERWDRGMIMIMIRYDDINPDELSYLFADSHLLYSYDFR